MRTKKRKSAVPTAKKRKILSPFWLLTVPFSLVFLAVVFFASALLLHPTGSLVYGEEDYIVTVQKTGEDFVILNLTDIQLCDTEDFFDFSDVLSEIDALVAETKPDLITLTGDQTWSNENNLAIHAIIKKMESYGIPWAPVLGNHDLGNGYNTATASGDYLASLYEKADHCLFRRGKAELGYGNYIIKVMDGEKLYKVLYMMDNGNESEFSDGQIAWMRENAEKLTNEYGTYTAICFFHQPIPQYREAYYAYLSGNAEAVGDVYVACSLSGVEDNGFFETAKSCNVTDIVCGHQHSNAFTIAYDGIRLTFALKTGDRSFYYEDENGRHTGGTVLTVGKDTVTVEKAETKLSPP